jgi:glycine/D-amino acid oxidase-like deaminating enzyme
METVEAGNPAVVLGGRAAGLTAARLLARAFQRVVVPERDQRGGVPQLRHSHASLARLRLVLLARRVLHLLEPTRALARDSELVLRSLPMSARVLAGFGPSLPFEPVPRDAALARMAS